ETLDEVVRRLVRGTASACVNSADEEDWGRVNVLLDGVAGQGRAKAAAVRVATMSKRASEPADIVSERAGAAASGLRGAATREDVAQSAARASEPADIVTVASGNLAMVYLSGCPGRLTVEALTAGYPELVEGLVTHPGIG